VSYTIVGILSGVAVARILDIGVRDWAASLLPPGVAGTVMAAAMIATEHALHPRSPGSTAAVLVLLAVGGTAVYAAALWLISRERLREFLRDLDSFAPVSRLHRRLIAGRA
jgi:hypothetical protein